MDGLGTSATPARIPATAHWDPHRSSRAHGEDARVVRGDRGAAGDGAAAAGPVGARRGSTAGAQLGTEPSLEELVGRARGLAAEGRALLGIAGPPGAGKSTLAAQLVATVPDAVLVPMDGFHLDDAVLAALGLQDRKGAPGTFDAPGYVHLLRRLVARDEDVVYAPDFRRDLELSVAAALPVPRAARLVVTEGNYLLADGPFAPVRDLLDEVWYLDTDPVLRRERLVARHVAHGRSRAAAEDWVERSDEPNAVLVHRTRRRADLVVRLR